MEYLTYDGSNEQSGHMSKFQAKMRSYDIQGHTSEPERSKQNPCEGVIRELRRRWYRTMFQPIAPHYYGTMDTDMWLKSRKTL